MSGRVERLRAELEGLGARSFLVTDTVSVRYLTGFESSNAALLATAGGSFLLTDGRYTAAAAGVDGVELVESARDIPGYLGRTLGDLADEPVAFEADHLTVAAHEAVAASGVELLPTRAVVKRLRATKDEQELETIRRAARIADDVYVRLAREAFVGLTEAEVAWWIVAALHEEGADATAFDPIVASGPNAARPHHRPGARRIEAGELVIVDVGARLDGYCSDCTRTFATGPLPDELARAYAVCQDAQARALAAVRAEASGVAVDGIARKPLEEAGYEVFHGLGHGVGLEVHELPVLRKETEDVLLPRSVVTVEPGVYLAGLGGVRIEDLVIVTDDGSEILTTFTKDLVTVG